MGQTRTGAMKIAARRAGMTPEEYFSRCNSGEKHCTKCKTWHPRDAFGEDRTRGDGLSASCLASRRVVERRDMRGIARRVGWIKAAREGDRLQARTRVNYLVTKGRIPDPNALPCTDCGHTTETGPSRRHEYDHHKGYSAEHQLDVEVVCTRCHHARSRCRGEITHARNERGIFCRKVSNNG